MSFTVFIMQLVMSESSWAVLVAGPPDIWTPKPNSTAATIRGRMARRLSSSIKSDFVKKFTIMSPKPSVSPTSPSTTVY